MNTFNKSILFFLVDDDDDEREFFTWSFKKIKKEVQCITAKNGEEALNLLKQNENFIPDFILLDRNMPRIDGKECLVEIKKINRLKNTPVYIYSNSSTEKDIADILSLGAADYIIKPNSVDKLFEILSGIFLKLLKTPNKENSAQGGM
jgi:DNA-binding response OmpR family regulator